MKLTQITYKQRIYPQPLTKTGYALNKKYPTKKINKIF